MQKRYRDDLEVKSPPLCCLVHGDPKAPRCLHCGATICSQCGSYYQYTSRTEPQVSNHFFNGVCRIRPHRDILDKEEAIRNLVEVIKREKSRSISDQLYERAAQLRDLEVKTFRGDIGKREW